MKRVFTLTAVLAFLLISFKSYTYRTGPGGGYSNAPDEANCTTSGCHTGTALNGGSGSLDDLTLTMDPDHMGYMPDSTYTLTLSYKQSGVERWGFNMTALAASDDAPAGTFAKTDNRTQTRSKFVSGKNRNYMEHTTLGSASANSDSVQWTFQWKAPSTDVGKVKFYVAVNAANNNANTTGDEIYAKVFEFDPVSKVGIAGYNVSPNVSMYPNPVQDEVQIRWNEDVAGSTAVSVYALGGEQVAGYKVEGSVFSLNLSELPAGLYVVQLTNNGVTAYQRLVKN